MNKPLLRKIIKLIQEEPRRMHMEAWIRTCDEIAPCGTTGCIAGCALIISKQEKSPGMSFKEAGFVSNSENPIKKGAELLEITGDQIRTLFYLSQWPIFYKDKYSKATSCEDKAKVVILRIKNFMKTGL